MIAKGRPTIEITKGDEKLSPCFELYHYAEEIKKILTMADRALGIAGERIKYNCISSMLSKIEAESGEYIRLIKELPPEELDDFCDEYSAECDCRLQCDGEDLSKLGVFIDMILEEEKRGQEDDEYCSWPQQKKNGLYWSTYLLSVLVRKLENEREEAYGLLELAGECPEEPQNDTKIKMRKEIVAKLSDLADRGDWVNGITADDIKKMLSKVLGMIEIQLTGKESEMSKKLWSMLEGGRGDDRVRLTWQNMVGYFMGNGLLNAKSAPKLNIDFFGDKKGSDNINKGRYGRLAEIEPLLDKYLPKMKKQS